MNLIKKTPMATSALALSLAALGNLLSPYGSAVRYFCGILSAGWLILFTLKLILTPHEVKAELQNPIVFSILPTAPMAAILLCGYLKPYLPVIPLIWYFLLLLQLCIMLFFMIRFVFSFQLKNVFPSWLVTGAGIAIGSVTCPAMNARLTGQICFYIGFTLSLLLLPLVLYRMQKLKPIPEPAKPTLAIFAAPISLCLTGYLSAFEQPNTIVVWCLLGLATINYLYASIKMLTLTLLRLPFYPTCAAFAFPYVISAIAFRSANLFFSSQQLPIFKPLFHFVVKASEYLAVVLVLYVLLRYLIFLMPKFSPAKK